MKLRLFVNARFCVGLACFLNDVVCCLLKHRFVSALGCFCTVVVFVRYNTCFISFGCCLQYCWESQFKHGVVLVCCFSQWS